MSMSEIGSREYEPLPKKPRIEFQGGVGRRSLTSDEQAHLEAIEEAALKDIIWDTCGRSLELCKELSDQLYRSLLDGAAVLAYLLFDKEELYALGGSHMLYDQQNKFWNELERFAEKGDSVDKVSKWIASTSIDRKAYSFLNECDVADMLMTYNNFNYRKTYVNYIVHGHGDVLRKSPIDDDIQEAMKKAKLYPRLTVDQYTLLLLEIFRDHSVKCQEFLLAKAVECIDIEALYGLEADAIQELVRPNLHSSANEDLDFFIKFDLLELIMKKRHVVTDRLRTSFGFFFTLFTNEFDYEELAELRDMPRPPPDVFELIKVAELRRKAEGSRFINMNHFLWAFDECGCGLHIAFKDELSSRMAAEDEDHPPYHMYDIVLRLARAEYVPPNVNHLAFAVIFGPSGSSVEAVKEMKGKFKRFEPAMYGVSKPTNLIRAPNDFAYLRDDNMKVFMERLQRQNGVSWDPFKGDQTSTK